MPPCKAGGDAPRAVERAPRVGVWKLKLKMKIKRRRRRQIGVILEWRRKRQLREEGILGEERRRHLGQVEAAMKAKRRRRRVLGAVLEWRRKRQQLREEDLQGEGRRQKLRHVVLEWRRNMQRGNARRLRAATSKMGKRQRARRAVSDVEMHNLARRMKTIKVRAGDATAAAMEKLTVRINELQVTGRGRTHTQMREECTEGVMRGLVQQVCNMQVEDGAPETKKRSRGRTLGKRKREVDRRMLLGTSGIGNKKRKREEDRRALLGKSGQREPG